MGREVIEEVIRLAVGSGLPLTVTLALILVAALVMVLGRRFGGVVFPTYTPPHPPPPAEWGDNVKPNDGPPGGGMEGG